MKHHPPRIAHLIYALHTGGMENGLVNIINRCPPERYEHVIICLTDAGNFAARLEVAGVRVIELHKPPGHSPAFYLRFWKLLRELAPDILHTRNIAPLEFQLFSIGNPGMKRVHGEHGRDVNDLDGSNWKYRCLRKLGRPLIDRYIAVSRDLERWLSDSIGVNSRKLTQIYNGVDLETFGPSAGGVELLPAAWREIENRLLLGTVGRLDPVKDQRRLLLALDRMRSDSPALFARVRLAIIGDGPEKTALTALAKQLGLADQVWFAGNRDDVPQLLAAMDVFVLPSLAEGISNTVLEAMASGRPVIATAVGGNLELVEHGFNGLTVPVADEAALCGAMITLLASADERQRMGSNARHWVGQNFDWNATVNAYLGVYDQLLHNVSSELMGGVN